MYDVHGVQVRHTGGYVLGEAHSLLPGQSLAHVVDQVLERAARDELCHQVQLLVLVQHTDEPQHVVVVQTPQHGHLISRERSQLKKLLNKGEKEGQQNKQRK